MIVLKEVSLIFYYIHDISMYSAFSFSNTKFIRQFILFEILRGPDY